MSSRSTSPIAASAAAIPAVIADRDPDQPETAAARDLRRQDAERIRSVAHDDGEETRARAGQGGATGRDPGERLKGRRERRDAEQPLPVSLAGQERAVVRDDLATDPRAERRAEPPARRPSARQRVRVKMEQGARRLLHRLGGVTACARRGDVRAGHAPSFGARTYHRLRDSVNEISRSGWGKRTPPDTAPRICAENR